MTHQNEHLHKVQLVHNPRYKRHGTGSYLWTMKKYQFTPSQPGPYTYRTYLHQQGKHGVEQRVGGHAHAVRELVKQDPAGKQGQVPAQDIQNDAEYLCAVGIGSPAQTVNLDFDTGSADLWVSQSMAFAVASGRPALSSLGLLDGNQGRSALQQPPCLRSVQVFDVQEDVGLDVEDSVRRRIGRVGRRGHVGRTAPQLLTSAYLASDNVTIGGLVVNNQAVELAQQLSSEFQSGAGDGLLGLAWGNVNTVKPHAVQTPVENMIAQKDIPAAQELFTAKLTSSKSGADAFYTFGYIDQATLAGQTPHYTAIDNSQGFWQFPSTTAKVAGKTVRRARNTSIADTGTTLCLVDDNFCQDVYGAIRGAKYDDSNQGWVFPSSVTESQLPVVQVDVGGQLFTINKENLGFADAGNGYMYGGIQSRGDMTFDIYGDVFLKSVYAIFDVGNKRFGCVQRAEDH